MASGEGSQAIPLGPEWRNWQTQETQNLPPVTRRVGSTPSSGTNPALRSVLVPSDGAGLLDLRPAASVFESDPPSSNLCFARFESSPPPPSLSLLSFPHFLFPVHPLSPSLS